ncbi:MAG TPA: sigma-70 family RNA polymerase sigma factor [Burkholderiales bacterium]|nr:sigma-70 family RNA polymerase sigma factor [Burkholderiales bacterium]
MAATPAAAGPEPVAELYGELRTALIAFLRKRTGDSQVAEDLFHDVVVKALASSRNEARAPENLTAWLYTVARNAAADYHRRQRPTEELPADVPDTREEADAALAALSNCLRPMAEALPDPYRGTLIAAEFDDKPLRELAEAEGVSLSAIKSRASRGRRMLRQKLVACCRVAVSGAGTVLDYDARAARACETDCGTSANPGHKDER